MKRRTVRGQGIGKEAEARLVEPTLEFGSCPKGNGKPLMDLDGDSDDPVCVFKHLSVGWRMGCRRQRSRPAKML